jgi:hypothetical protein
MSIPEGVDKNCVDSKYRSAVYREFRVVSDYPAVSAISIFVDIMNELEITDRIDVIAYINSRYM